MKKLFLLLAIIFSSPVFAQYDDADDSEGTEATAAEAETDNVTVVDGIVKKQHIKGKKPLMPAYVREANVLWSKTVWRTIDLRQKQNLYLYYPTQDIDDRKPLARVLYDAVINGEIHAYDPGADNEFERVTTPAKVCERLLKYGNGIESMDSVYNEETQTYSYVVELGADMFTEVKQIKVKEVWYFDNRYGALKCQILGLCPVCFYEANGQKFPLDLFWIYYPEAAGVLARQEAYSYNNDAQRQSFRDKFEMRLFSSYIYRESNVYNNRVISEISSNGIDQNLEAERIENVIFKHEHDMWEY